MSLLKNLESLEDALKRGVSGQYLKRFHKDVSQAIQLLSEPTEDQMNEEPPEEPPEGSQDETEE